MLSAIAAHHESMETGRRDLGDFSVAQGRQAVTWLNQNYLTLPIPLVLTSSIVLTALAALLNDFLWEQASRASYALIDLVGSDQQDLVSLLKRNRSRWCQLISPLPLLRVASIAQYEHDCYEFENLSHARKALEQILNKLALEARTGVALNRFYLAKWNANFEKLRHRVDYISWLGLRAACGMSVVQIEAMYSDTEMIYDQYLNIYQDLADAFEATLKRTSRPSIRFGIDGGLLHIMAWASRCVP